MHTPTDFFSAEAPLLEAALARALDDLPPALYPVAAHIALLPGKRLRPLICIATARCLGHSGDAVYPLAAALEILHCASLLHDDILDDAHTRRGAVAAHLKFNPGLTLLAGDAMFALALHMAAGYARPELISILSRAMHRTVAGQALESSRLFSPQADWEHYLQVAGGKTAALFEAAALSGATLAQAGPAQCAAAAAFGFNTGLAFQIMDDLFDFSPHAAAGKPQGSDLRQGKLTPPLLNWLDGLSRKDSLDFFYKFSKHELSIIDTQAICARIQADDILTRTQGQAEEYLQQANNCLKALPLNCFNDSLATLAHAIRI